MYTYIYTYIYSSTKRSRHMYRSLTCFNTNSRDIAKWSTNAKMFRFSIFFFFLELKHEVRLWLQKEVYFFSLFWFEVLLARTFTFLGQYTFSLLCFLFFFFF